MTVTEKKSEPAWIIRAQSRIHLIEGEAPPFTWEDVQAMYHKLTPTKYRDDGYRKEE